MMKDGWEGRFEEMQAEAHEAAKPLAGERLHGLHDLLANTKLPNGTRMDAAYMRGLTRGWRETHLLDALNAYIEFPNILRRRSERTGMEWHGLSPAHVRAREILMIARVARKLPVHDVDLPQVWSAHG